MLSRGNASSGSKTATSVDAHDMPIGDLVGRLSDDTVRLIHDEIGLARAEMTQKAKAMGLGTAMFGGAGVALVFGLGALIAAAIIGLATAVALWAAALIVAGALFLVAGVGALIGKREFTKATPPIPTEAVASSRQDVEDVKESLRA
jgi:hypothetical protein